MISEANRRERRNQARERLSELREQGYPYLVTRDEGASWIGCMADGIEIEVLLDREFIGNVVISEAV